MTPQSKQYLSGLNIFVTGGLGYIGSHTALCLVEHGARVTVIDNLSNSFPKVWSHLKTLAGKHVDMLKFSQIDLLDKDHLDRVFGEERYDAVIHFAGYKAVGESVQHPVMYYKNNFVGTINLIEVMTKHGCKNLVFSSSCTVYGMPEKLPITEESPLGAVSPYGKTKQFQEEMFRDLAASDSGWRINLLRYFNPVGAHPSGQIGEHPPGVPNNLMPYIQQVALGLRDSLNVYGGDYPTRDGTCVRDYIHVMDLAEGHVLAVKKILATPDYGCKAINLGTGKGTTVLEMIKAFEEASGVKVPYKIVGRRQGDTVAVWADASLAKEVLGWEAEYTIEDMCSHQWLWAKQFPQGYLTNRPSKEMITIRSWSTVGREF